MQVCEVILQPRVVQAVHAPSRVTKPPAHFSQLPPDSEAQPAQALLESGQQDVETPSGAKSMSFTSESLQNARDLGFFISIVVYVGVQ